jgi:hypothetical protein
MKGLCTCQEVKWDCRLAWVTEFHDNIVENLSSNDTLTNQDAKVHILNLHSNHCLATEASSNYSNPAIEANAISLFNRQKDMNMKKRSSFSSNSGTQECNRYRKHSLCNASGHICTKYQELESVKDKNGPEIVACVQEVANTSS